MSEEKREDTPRGEQDQEELRDSGLVDVFEEDEATRRFRLEDLEPEKPAGDPEDSASSKDWSFASVLSAR